MRRGLYRCLVWMHPPFFRRQFAAEMLWIFDETAQADGVFPLFLDGFVSVVRQWLLRSGYWRFAAGILGALVQVTIVGMLILHVFPSGVPSDPTAGEDPEMAGLVRLVALVAIGLLAAVMSLVLWWHRLARRTGG